MLTLVDRASERRGVLASYDAVTLKESSVDAERLSFPLQLVLTLGGMFLALVIGYFTGQAQWSKEMAGLRSDVRDGFTMLQGDRKADEIKMDVIRRDLDESMKDLKLLKLQRQEDHDDIVMLRKGH